MTMTMTMTTTMTMTLTMTLTITPTTTPTTPTTISSTTSCPKTNHTHTPPTKSRRRPFTFARTVSHRTPHRPQAPITQYTVTAT